MRHIASYTCAKDSLQVVLECIEGFRSEHAKSACVVLLQGEVGMGKSHIVQAYCHQNGIASSSPTFAFLHEYGHGIYHYDLYLKNDEYTLIRLYESLEREGVHFVEWGDSVLAATLDGMGFACMLIAIQSATIDTMRVYDIWV